MTKARSNATAPNAKGTLVVGNGTDASTTLAVASTAGYLLSVDSAEATGLKWAAPAGGGKVLQVVSATYSTQTQNFTQTMADTGLTASITPSSSSSKVLVLVSQNFWVAKSNATQIGVFARLMRGATEIQAKWPINLETPGASSNPLVIETEMGLSYLDSPATTSSTTYKTQFKLAYADAGGWGASANYQTTSSIILMEIGA